ncbi:methylated-DNA--[protein]-cysteine S-methyltransferase [Actinomadura flavalba]|uniref:methylated-DNA--[protein]-cysteine S-methyltransferase n=1 Tax=Actinomadura flavalba TaxID=1120938 RepID=UPI0003AAC0A4|nr:MGMT family protein [Actinomadura flavalba]
MPTPPHDPLTTALRALATTAPAGLLRDVAAVHIDLPDPAGILPPLRVAVTGTGPAFLRAGLDAAAFTAAWHARFDRPLLPATPGALRDLGHDPTADHLRDHLRRILTHALTPAPAETRTQRDTPEGPLGPDAAKPSRTGLRAPDARAHGTPASSRPGLHGPGSRSAGTRGPGSRDLEPSGRPGGTGAVDPGADGASASGAGGSGAGASGGPGASVVDLGVLDLSVLTPFEAAVLRTTASIPPGQTRPYTWVAAHAGRPGAVRAAGTALARNPLPLLIPCHRVTPADGSPGRYIFGPDAKARLLAAEHLDLHRAADLTRRRVRFLADPATGHVCHPTCPHAGTREYRTLAAALIDGHRPCPHCRPT